MQPIRIGFTFYSSGGGTANPAPKCPPECEVCRAMICQERDLEFEPKRMVFRFKPDNDRSWEPSGSTRCAVAHFGSSISNRAILGVAVEDS
jgi:hypothetical protein